jgi:hypothetical protein
MAKVTGPNTTEPSVHLPPHANAEVHAQIMADLEKMTPADFLASLVQAGICTADGQLTEHYAENVADAE